MRRGRKNKRGCMCTEPENERKWVSLKGRWKRRRSGEKKEIAIEISSLL